MRVVVVYENSDEQLIAPRVVTALSSIVNSIVTTIANSMDGPIRRRLYSGRVSVSVRSSLTAKSLIEGTTPMPMERTRETLKRYEPVMKPPSDIRQLDL